MDGVNERVSNGRSFFSGILTYRQSIFYQIWVTIALLTDLTH